MRYSSIHGNGLTGRGSPLGRPVFCFPKNVTETRAEAATATPDLDPPPQKKLGVRVRVGGGLGLTDEQDFNWPGYAARLRVLRRAAYKGHVESSASLSPLHRSFTPPFASNMRPSCSGSLPKALSCGYTGGRAGLPFGLTAVIVSKNADFGG